MGKIEILPYDKKKHICFYEFPIEIKGEVISKIIIEGDSVPLDYTPEQFREMIPNLNFPKDNFYKYMTTYDKIIIIEYS